MKDKDITFARGLKYILGGLALQAGLFGILSLATHSVREKDARYNLQTSYPTVTILDPYSIREIQDSNRDGIPDRTKNIIYGPSFGIDIGYRPCSKEETLHFYSNFKSTITGKQPWEK